LFLYYSLVQPPYKFKIDFKEIVKINKEKIFTLSLKGRNFLPDGGSEALDVSEILNITQEKRIETSLANTELDIPELRTKIWYNSKIPKERGWLDTPEKMSIEKMLSYPEESNYSIKTERN